MMMLGAGWTESPRFSCVCEWAANGFAQQTKTTTKGDVFKNIVSLQVSRSDTQSPKRNTFQQLLLVENVDAYYMWTRYAAIKSHG